MLAVFNGRACGEIRMNENNTPALSDGVMELKQRQDGR